MFISRSQATNIIAFIFIFLFSYTAYSKTMRIVPLRLAIMQSFWGDHWPGAVAWGVVFAEWIAVFLLLYHPFRLAGLYLSTTLMLVFTIYIGVMLAISSHLPCSCGGILKNLSWRDHFYLNTLLSLLAVAATVLETRRRRMQLAKA